MFNASDEKLTDPDEELYRHVKTSFFNRNGRITSLAFIPRVPQDQGHLSVDRSAVHSRAESFHLLNSRFANMSKGILTVSVGGVNDLDLAAYVHPIREENPAHSYIDLSHLDADGIEFAAHDLLKLAEENNGLWKPDN